MVLDRMHQYGLIEVSRPSRRIRIKNPRKLKNPVVKPDVQPVVKKPAAKPVAKKPVAKKPVAKKPIVEAVVAYKNPEYEPQPWEKDKVPVWSSSKRATATAVERKIRGNLALLRKFLKRVNKEPLTKREVVGAKYATRTAPEDLFLLYRWLENRGQNNELVNEAVSMMKSWAPKL